MLLWQRHRVKLKEHDVKLSPSNSMGLNSLVKG